jgi:lysophospholipase
MRTPVTAHFRAITLMTPDKRQLRGGIWDLPEGAAPRGICVLLNGLTEFLEKYGEVADELRGRGFIVASLDWRSQGASERKRAGNRASHVATFEEYDADLAALLLQAVEPIQRQQTSPLPVVALAHSMGAHVLLRFLHDNPRRFTCGVLIAPMLEVQTGPYSARATNLVTFAMNLRGASPRFVFGVEDRDPLELAFADNQTTSDQTRFERTRGLLKAQPYLRVHGPTFGWLGAALKSMNRLQKRGFADEITTPLLLVGAGRDKVVHTQAIRDYVKLLPRARYVEIEDSEHEILMENDSIRTRFWGEFDAFVEQQLGAGAGAFGGAPLL